MKTCSKCKTEKPATAFYPDKRKRTGLTSRCKPCGAKYAAEWRARNPHKGKERYWGNRDAERERHLVKKYGINFSVYAALLTQQGGACAICKRAPISDRFFDVDHCHATNVVRGLLCTSCNRMLGHAGDNPERLKAGAAYLQSSRKSPPRSSKQPV